MARWGAVLALAAWLAACAPTAPAPQLAAGPPATAVRARVVAVRALDGVSTGQAPVLRAIGAHADATATPGAAGTEIVLRTEDGRTVSVVQPDAAGLRPGDQVILQGAERVHVARAM